MNKDKLLILFFAFITIIDGSPLIYKSDNTEISGNQRENRTITEETLKKLFEKFKEFIGHDEGFKSQQYFINTSLVYLNATLNDLHVIDPSEYSVTQARVNMTTLNFDVIIEYPILNVTGNYVLEAENDAFHLIGNGSLSVNITDPTITISWKFNLTEEQTIEIEYFDLNYIIPEIKVNITNLGGDEEVSQTLNDLINTALPSLINDTKNDVEKIVNKFVQHYSLFFLYGMTVDQFIEHVYEIIDM